MFTNIYRLHNYTGVYKHWTGLLEWWNSGMVDWIFLFGFLIIYDVAMFTLESSAPPILHNSALKLV